MSPKTVIFCGTPRFAVLSLRALHGDPHFTVTHVITQPDRPVGRSKEPVPSDVKVAAQELGIPVWQPESINKEIDTFAATVERPDFLVVVAYGKILGSTVLAWPTIAPINVHGSILPRWRGASPIEHAILHGDESTGVTVQIMAKELDSGDTLSMAQTPIGPLDTSLTLRERLSRMGAELLVETLSMPLEPKPQPTQGITICGKIEKTDGIVDPTNLTAIEIDRRIRAYTPWPGVTTAFHGKQVKILSASLSEAKHGVPLPCKNGTTLYITELVEAGKKPMKAAEWLRGIR